MTTDDLLVTLIFIVYSFVLLMPCFWLFDVVKELDRTLAINEVQVGHMPTNCVFEENCLFTAKELKELGVNIQYIKEVKEN